MAPDGHIFCLCPNYGDPHKPTRQLFHHNTVTRVFFFFFLNNQMIFIRWKSAVCVCVNWWESTFIICLSWLQKIQKVYLQSVGKYYAVTVLLTTCHKCSYGRRETKICVILPPQALIEYLSTSFFLLFVPWDYIYQFLLSNNFDVIDLTSFQLISVGLILEQYI